MTIGMLPITKRQTELLKVYIFLFTIVFLAMDWGHVSWVFNYQEISRFASPDDDTVAVVKSTTQPEVLSPESSVAAVSSSTIDNDEFMGKNTDIKKNANSVAAGAATSGTGDYIEIPAINVRAPVVMGTSTDVNALHKDLDKGVVYYPGSSMPGSPGQTVILGHSAPVGWPEIKHDKVFSEIDALAEGSSIILHFQNHIYSYKVEHKMIVDRGQDISPPPSEKGNILTLVSCWPPGKDYKRIAVEAVLEN